MNKLPKILSISDLLKEKKQKKIIPNWEFFSNFLLENDWNNIFSSDYLEINLSNLDYIPHDGLIWISFILLNRRLINNNSAVSLPNNNEQVNFLKYIKYDELIKKLHVSLENYIEFENIISKYNPTLQYKKALRQQEIVDGDFLQDRFRNYRDGVIDILKKIFNIDKETFIPDESYDRIYKFCQILYEMVENIVAHGGYEDGDGIGLVSFVPPGQKGIEYSMAFSDCGRGFVKCFMNKLEESKSNSQINQALNELKSIQNPIEFYRRMIGYILIYRYINPDKKGYVGFYKILPFLSLFKATLKIRTDKFICSVDFSKTNYYSFCEQWENPNIDWICSFIKKPRVISDIRGSHIKIVFPINNRGSK